MKKAIRLFLAAVLTLLLCACGTPETTIRKLETVPSTSASEAETALSDASGGAPSASESNTPAPPEEKNEFDGNPAEAADAESEMPARSEETADAADAEPEMPAGADAESSTASSGGSGSGSGGSASGSVTVPEPETGENLVWVPTNGGTKYHTYAGCSNMKNPIQVTLETAAANGFSPCKRCH